MAMKTTDLMIGDWVYIHEPVCKGHRIDFIDELGFQVGADGEVYDDCNIRPIPLTEDILVKNGWRKHTMLYKNEWYGDICLFEEYGKFYYMDLKIEYVHQLQHLLRLVGIKKEVQL